MDGYDKSMARQKLSVKGDEDIDVAAETVRG
jgi:hypothetical protein